MGRPKSQRRIEAEQYERQLIEERELAREQEKLDRISAREQEKQEKQDRIDRPWMFDDNFENRKSISTVLFPDQTEDIEKTMTRIIQAGKLSGIHKIRMLNACLNRLNEGLLVLSEKGKTSLTIEQGINSLKKKRKSTFIITGVVAIIILLFFLWLVIFVDNGAEITIGILGFGVFVLIFYLLDKIPNSN